MIHMNFRKYPDNTLKGFTLFEVLLVVSLSGFLFMGFLDFFLHNIKLFHKISNESELLHQARTGMETLIYDLQEANPSTIVLTIENMSGLSQELQFCKYDSQETYWYYVNSTQSLIKAIKKPDSEWGRNAVAEKIEYLHIKADVISGGMIKLLVLKIGAKNEDMVLEYTTSLSPGF